MGTYQSRKKSKEWTTSTWRASPELFERLRKEARDQNTSVNKIVNDVLEAHLRDGDLDADAPHVQARHVRALAKLGDVRVCVETEKESFLGRLDLTILDEALAGLRIPLVLDLVEYNNEDLFKHRAEDDWFGSRRFFPMSIPLFVARSICEDRDGKRHLANLEGLSHLQNGTGRAHDRVYATIFNERREKFFQALEDSLDDPTYVEFFSLLRADLHRTDPLFHLGPTMIQCSERLAHTLSKLFLDGKRAIKHKNPSLSLSGRIDRYAPPGERTASPWIRTYFDSSRGEHAIDEIETLFRKELPYTIDEIETRRRESLRQNLFKKEPPTALSTGEQKIVDEILHLSTDSINTSSDNGGDADHVDM